MSQSSPLPDSEDYPVTLIQPVKGWVSLGLRELWEYRELLYFITWRDIQVRYRQTILGASWAILNPFFTMVVFSIFFGNLAKIQSNGLPYPIFSYTALLPWFFFSNGLSRSANSIVGSANLIKKVYFPRLVIPVSTVIGGIPDFLLSLIVLVGMMLYYSIYPSAISLLWLPLFLLLALVSSLGVGLWLSALNTQYRDVRYIVPFITQIWLYATPVVYPTNLLPDRWRLIYGLNPMVGVVEGFRWALLNSGNRPDATILISAAMAVFLTFSGAFYFRRTERVFADVV
jgi:lipopolysaccharide transport system permease protein